MISSSARKSVAEATRPAPVDTRDVEMVADATREKQFELGADRVDDLIAAVLSQSLPRLLG